MSLSTLRTLVAFLSFDEELKSGNQQDGVEFLTRLLEHLPSELTSFFRRTEFISSSFLENGEKMPCPTCGTYPNSRENIEQILHLPMSESSDAQRLDFLVKEYFKADRNYDGKRCSLCCIHGDTICPGKDVLCTSRAVVEDKSWSQHP